MKNVFKLNAFILLLCSLIFSTCGIVSADEVKTEDSIVTDTEKSKDSVQEKKKKKADEEEEPECE